MPGNAPSPDFGEQRMVLARLDRPAGDEIRRPGQTWSGGQGVAKIGATAGWPAGSPGQGGRGHANDRRDPP